MVASSQMVTLDSPGSVVMKWSSSTAIQRPMFNFTSVCVLVNLECGVGIMTK